MSAGGGRLLLVLPDLGRGGMQLQLLELARAWARVGRRAVLMAPDGPLGDGVRAVADHERVDWDAPRLETARRARALMGEGGVAVMQADPSLVHLVPSLAATGRLHLCLHNRPDTFEGWFDPAALERFRALLPALVASRRVTFTASNSAFAAEHARRLGLPPELVTGWFPGVDPPPGYDALSSGPVRRVAVVARLSREKLAIVAAGAELVAAGLAAGADVRLELHGDGPGEAEARALLGRALPRDRFALHGPTDAPLEAIAAADVAVNGGRAAIEALVTGRRVLVPRIGAGPGGPLGPPVLPGSFAELKERNFTWQDGAWEGGPAWDALSAMPAGDVTAVRDRARRELSTRALLEGHLAAIARADGGPEDRGVLLEAVTDLALELEDARVQAQAVADALWAARGD